MAGKKILLRIAIIKDGSHHEENALLNGGLSNKAANNVSSFMLESLLWNVADEWCLVLR